MTVVLGPQTGVPVIPATREGACSPSTEGELRYQRCIDCDTANFTPTDVCRGCSSRALRWAASAGRGSVYSWTVVRRPPTGDAAAPARYAVAIVDLDEGLRMLTNLVEVDPDEIHTGMRVRVDLRPAGEEPVLPCFLPEQRRSLG